MKVFLIGGHLQGHPLALACEADGRQPSADEAAEAAGVSKPALERGLKELGVRPVYTRKRPTKAKKPSNKKRY